MQTRALGRSAIQVPRISLGCVTFGREIDQAASFAILDHAVERGIRLLDTAEAYAGEEPHSSEMIIGRWLKATGARSRILLQTKASWRVLEGRIRETVEQSLERLQTDHLDTFLFHDLDPTMPVEDAAGAMTEMIGQGLIRAWGASNWTAEALQGAIEHAARHGLARPETIEPIYNLVHRDIEQDILPLCVTEEIGVTSYSPLGAGFLTGKYSPDRNALPEGTRFAIKPGHVDVYFSGRAFTIVEELRRQSAASGRTMAQLALDFVLDNPAITSVLIGARTTAQIDNALQVVEERIN